MHKNSELLFTRYALPLFESRHRVLEVGPDGPRSFYRVLANRFGVHPQWDLTDMGDRPNLAFRMAEYVMPIDDSHYDIVLSGQVIEHVRRPWVWLRELARVCKPGGAVITICPVSWPFHEEPIDCWRIYPDGMRALYSDAGLEISLVRCQSLDECEVDTIAIGTK